MLEGVASLVARYVWSGEVQMVFEPVGFIGSDSVAAGRFAVAAGYQDRLWSYAGRFYRRQGEENSGYATPAFLRSVATTVPGLDPARVASDAARPATNDAIEASYRLFQHYRLSGVPSFAIGRTGGELHAFNGPWSPGIVGTRIERELRGR
jgi:protein-disulfide isomerase-like protein with CxxC motif